VDAYPQPQERPAIAFTLARLKKVLGIELSLERVEEILTSLGFSTSQERIALTAKVPYWRSDITQEDDLVEEIARIIGYDDLPTTKLSTPVPAHQPQPERELREKVKDIMVACGMQEVISYSLTSAAALEMVPSSEDGVRPLRLANPMSAEQEYLRTTLRSSILSTLATNQHHLREGLKLFEVGRVYIPRPKDMILERPADLPLERETLVGVVAGPRWPEGWLGSEGDLDFFDAKGILETFLGQLRIDSTFEPIEDPLFLPGRCARVMSDRSPLGIMGEVHTRVLERFQIDTSPVILFEMDLEALLQAIPSGPSQYRPLARYPGAYRDLALVLDRDVPASRVQEIIEQHTLVARATLFDVYEGSGVLSGKRSLAYRILLQSTDRTLGGEEVSQAQSEIVAALERDVGASLRS
jgi:phenylalanyl-tRNA synthetase beta chain